MPITRQEKVRRMMTNFVGAGASVAVVAAAVTLSVNVSAQFLDLVVFRDKAFYQVEVIQEITIEGSLSSGQEAPPEPEPPSVRLRVQNQWDDYYLTLTTGINEGFIEPLRENQTYTLTVELENALNWSSIATETFRTRPRTLAVISTIDDVTTANNPLMDIRSSIYTQNEIEGVGTWSARLTGPQVNETLPLNVGDNAITFTDVPHTNDPLTLAVLVETEGTSRVVTERVYTPSVYVDASVSFAFEAVDQLTVTPAFGESSLPNVQFEAVLSAEGLPSQTYPLTSEGFTINEMIAGVNYTFAWFVLYGDNPLNLTRVLVESRTITPIVKPLFVLSIQPLNPGHRFSLTIDRDVAYASVVIRLTQGNTVRELTMTRVSDSPVAILYEALLETSLLSGTLLDLIVTQAEPHAYPITIHSITYGG